MLELGVLDFLYEPRSVKLKMLLKKPPRLQVLILGNLNLRNLSVSSFRGVGLLRLLLLNSKWALGLDSSLLELISRTPPYVYFPGITFICQCEALEWGLRQHRPQEPLHTGWKNPSARPMPLIIQDAIAVLPSWSLPT